jgi:hypothetical protein
MRDRRNQPPEGAFQSFFGGAPRGRRPTLKQGFPKLSQPIQGYPSSFWEIKDCFFQKRKGIEQQRHKVARLHNGFGAVLLQGKSRRLR